MALEFKENDTHNAIKSILKSGGEAIDLTDCTVYISISDIVYEDECTIVDEKEGTVAYPAANFTDNAGWYRYEFIVEYSDGTRERVPNQSYYKLRVYEEIKEDW